MPENKPLRALIWSAVSTKVQANEHHNSIEMQEQDAREWAEKEGHRIIAEPLRVPGHSRYERDIHELNQRMLKRNIHALDDLMKHIKAKDFDVLIVRDVERFARKASLMVRIIEEIVEVAGARIYSTQDGWIDSGNYLGWMSLASFKTGTDAKRKTKGQRDGMGRRRKEGLPDIAPPLSHKYLWDNSAAKPRAIKMVVDEDKRRLLDTLRDLVLEGVGWGDFSTELANRGFPAERHNRDYWRLFFHNALVWGNQCSRDVSIAPAKHIYGRYCFSPTMPPRPGITVTYGTHDAAWTGEDAARIQQALLHLREWGSGKVRPHSRHKFSLLLVCSVCKHALIYVNRHGGEYQCWHAGRSVDGAPICSNRQPISERDVQTFFDGWLHQMDALPDVNTFFNPIYGTQEDYARQITDTENQLFNAQQEAFFLIKEQSAKPDLAHLYEVNIRKTNEAMKGLETQLEQLRQREKASALPDRVPLQKRMHKRLPTFWESPDDAINEDLTVYLAGLKAEVSDGQITQLLPDPRPPRGRPPRGRPPKTSG